MVLFFISSIRNFNEFSISSIIKIEACTSPVPLQDGQTSAVLISVSGRTRCLVSSITPNLLGGIMLYFALSPFINFLKESVNFLLFSLAYISIKSTTIIPPISRSLKILAISSAASMFVCSAFSS